MVLAPSRGDGKEANFIQKFGRAFVRGDAFTKLSLLVWGLGYIGHGQLIKALLVTLVQGLGLYFLGTSGIPALKKLGTLGTVQMEMQFNPVTLKNEVNNYDNSFAILLLSVIAMVIIVSLVVAAMMVVQSNYLLQQQKAAGKKPNSFRQDINCYLNEKFYVTLLTLPVLGVVLFTIIPLIVMILIGFTNYDRNHLPPSKLFTWVGLDNFSKLTALTADSSFGYAFTRVLAWTLVWAVLATFTCYIGGILMAMFINNRNTKGKKFWRTCFMVAMAVPQFVSLLLVRNFFADLGIVNTICKNIGLTDWLYSIGAIPTANFIPFLTHPAWARPMIILINIWVGIPYQMLIATGILMNIPTELIEAAKIDGANAWQSFKSITMPYILFITGPSLVNSLVANINNFNVIWLLSRDVYTTSDQLMANANANEVDLLVTWLYRLTQDQSNYKMASVIGILVFVVCAILTLVAFSRMIKGDKEESFQ
mgnify:CR=1 FL=1